MKADKEGACCEEMQPAYDELIKLGEDPNMVKTTLSNIHEIVSNNIGYDGDFTFILTDFVDDVIVFESNKSKEVYLDCLLNFAEKQFLRFEMYTQLKKLKNFIEEYKNTELRSRPKSIETKILEESEPINDDFTTARQVMAIHYLFELCKVKNIDHSIKADFIQFLTGKNYKNIYEAVRNPLSTKEKKFRKKDLQFIRPYFEKLELTEIVKMINNELDKPSK